MSNVFIKKWDAAGRYVKIEAVSRHQPSRWSLIKVSAQYLALIFWVAWFTPFAQGADAGRTATDFLRHLQRGELERAKRLLDDSGSRYRHQGGDDIYFVYESGYEPNLAFLVSHPFVLGAPSVKEQRSDWYFLDGTIYANVALPLRFESYQPWILPAGLAFGRAMEFNDFINFVVFPGNQTEHLSLRIRPSLEPGLIKPPKPQFVAAPPPAAAPGGSAVAARSAPLAGYGSLFGSRPVDPGPVVLPSGEKLNTAQIARFLPRLSAVTLNLALIRGGRFASWGVMRWNFTSATLITEKGEVMMGSGLLEKQ